MVTIEHNGFHGTHAVKVRANLPNKYGEIEISAQVAARINAAACPSRGSGCRCGEYVAHRCYGNPALWAIAIPGDWVPGETVRLRGNYPQD